MRIVLLVVLLVTSMNTWAHDGLHTTTRAAAQPMAEAPRAATVALAPSPAASVATLPAKEVETSTNLAVAKLNKAVAKYHLAKNKGFIQRNWAKMKLAVAASKVAKVNLGKDKKLIYILAGALAIILAFVINSTLGFITLAVGVTLFVIYLL